MVGSYLPLPPTQQSGAVSIADCVVIRAGVLCLNPSSCSDHRSRACISIGQHGRANHVSSGVGETALKF